MDKSPFPGMDPYLEGEMWQEFHDRLANQISAQLMAVLPPQYVALLNKYYILDRSGVDLALQPKKRAVYPDVHITRVKESAASYTSATPPAAKLVTPILVEAPKIPIQTIEIRDTAERRLVAVIEILSPVNKTGDGFHRYVEKRLDLMETDTHLLEIDLLRGGKRLPLFGVLPPAPYYTFLSRSDKRPTTEVWPIQLREALPTVPVPLLAPDPDVPLVLQQAIDACFSLVRYHERLLDYSQAPPPPPLEQEDATWVESVVKKK